MRGRKFFPYLIILPCVVLLIIFRVLPIFTSIFASIHSIKGGEQVFNNFLKYKEVFSDKMLLQSIWNSFIIFVILTIISVPMLVLFGTLINSLKRRKKHYLKIVYLPTIVGVFAYGIIFRLLFSFDGIINSALKLVFGIKPDWFGINILAQNVVAFAILVSSFGIFLLMVVNALQHIPTEQNEAARLEGASYTQMLRYVVLPNIKGLLWTVVFFSLIESITIVDIPMNLTKGAPNGSTITIGYYIYASAFSYNDFSYAATIGVLMMVALLIVVPIFRKIGGKNEEDI